MQRHEDAPSQGQAALDEFYAQHAELIMLNLQLAESDALEYCERQRATPDATEDDKARELTALAMGVRP